MADTTEKHGMFIQVEVAPAVAGNTELAKKLVDVCPVNIFGQGDDGTGTIVEENLDECVLCDLCVEAAPPGGVRVVKLYSGEVLQR